MKHSQSPLTSHETFFVRFLLSFVRFVALFAWKSNEPKIVRWINNGLATGVYELNHLKYSKYWNIHVVLEYFDTVVETFFHICLTCHIECVVSKFWNISNNLHESNGENAIRIDVIATDTVKFRRIFRMRKLFEKCKLKRYHRNTLR